MNLQKLTKAELIARVEALEAAEAARTALSGFVRFGVIKKKFYQELHKGSSTGVRCNLQRAGFNPELRDLYNAVPVGGTIDVYIRRGDLGG